MDITYNILLLNELKKYFKKNVCSGLTCNKKVCFC